MAVDFALYRRLIIRMVEAGIRVVTPNGNTSEFYSLTAAEQRRELEETVIAIKRRNKVASTDVLVLAGIGSDIHTAAEMARHARVLGVHAAMIHQPVHPYRSNDGWITYHQTIADAVLEVGIVP